MTQTSHLPTLDGLFSPDFTWGAATASYQIEGAAHEDGRGESIWDRFSHTVGNTNNGDTGDVACDHYHRWREDIALMRSLELNAYRFSIAWPRILPEGTGRVNQPGLDFYDRLVDGLLEAGITPWVTLYHWDLPQVLEDAGGWPNRATAEAFVEYADVVSRRLGDRVKHWATFNEPWCSAFLGYSFGKHAPGRTSLSDALQAAHTLLLAHGMAVPILRRNSPAAQVGIVLNLTHAYSASESQPDYQAARRLDGFLNRWFLDPLYGRGYPEDMLELYGEAAPAPEAGDLESIATPIDFMGINYYTPAFVQDAPQQLPLRADDSRPAHAETTAMGWVVHPQGLYDLLLRLHRDYPSPALYITENGAAYQDQLAHDESGAPQVRDLKRLAYIARHLQAVERAIAAGVPLKGYFAWSLLDNFEWAEGYAKRFGLVYVDYETQQRVVKESGRWYAQLVRRQRNRARDQLTAGQGL